MSNSKSRLFKFISSVGLLVILSVSSVFADVDPNPNSPSPVLISQPDSIRVLTDAPFERKLRGGMFSSKRGFALDSVINIYAANLDLMKNEGADALRLYVTDANGRMYRFPVLDVRKVDGTEAIYQLSVKLRDEIGYWDEIKADGDVLISLAWRGNVSNSVRLGISRIGGNLKTDENLLPTPWNEYADKKPSESKNVEIDEPDYIGYKYSGDRIRFLEQATFGPTDELDQRVRRIGLRTWLAEQFEANYPASDNPYPELELKPTNIPMDCDRICRRDYYTMYPVQNWFFKQAFYGDAQLKHRVAWSLNQIWVVSGEETQQASHIIEYHKILSKHAFGNYRNLMEEMTLNPAMGNYLDMARSTKNNPNENYAREILQLFSIGLFMLNQDGTLKLDNNGKPIATYSQETVNNFTKVFTGWAFCNNGNNAACSNAVSGTVNYKDPLLLTQNNHDTSAKTLLAYPNAVNPTLPAGQNGTADLKQALDNIFYHPNLAPFVGKLLIQHLVTSDPTPAYVGRVAAAFNNNGNNVRGDLKAVIRAILLDPEARGDKKTDPNYGKLREPVQLLTNLARQFDVRSANGTGESDGEVSSLAAYMGQNPFYSPTVFNYYSPDYTIPGTTLLAPEFGIMTTGTSISRVNVATILALSKIEPRGNAPFGTSLDFSEMTELAKNDATGNKLLDALNRKLMHGAMSAEMRSKILTAVLAVPASTPDFRAKTAVFLIASSSQYQVQR